MDAETLYVLLAIGIVIGGNILYRLFMKATNTAIHTIVDAHQNKKNHIKQDETNSNKREKL